MAAILKAEGLFKKYGNTVAVDDISFEVNKGEIFGFLGPNGAGKTTSIKMMSGLVEPDRGRVVFEQGDRRGTIGVCPQSIVVWENLTCIEQLAFIGEMYGIRARYARNRGNELLETLGLAEKRNALAKTLSGGMQRRLNLALALVHSPAIVFLDEPQAGLDPQSRVLVRDYIRSIRNDTTVVLTTHDMDEAEKLSDRICIMDRGKLLAIGTRDEIGKAGGYGNMIEISIEGDIRNELIRHLGNDSLAYELTSTRSAICKIGNTFNTLENLLRVVKEKQIKVIDLRLRKTSLEDIFIRMTGRSLRE